MLKGLYCWGFLSLTSATFASLASLPAIPGFGMISMEIRVSFGVDLSAPLMYSVASRWIFCSFLRAF